MLGSLGAWTEANRENFGSGKRVKRCLLLLILGIGFGLRLEHTLDKYILFQIWKKKTLITWGQERKKSD